VRHYPTGNEWRVNLKRQRATDGVVLFANLVGLLMEFPSSYLEPYAKPEER
jgi:hypothetical protein